MGSTGRVVDEPWLLGVLGADRVQPLDRLVGDVVREVVQLPVRTLGNADGRVVLGDDGVVLTCGSGQETPPVVETPSRGPVVERARRAHVVSRGHVPLAEPAGYVSVLLQDPGQRRAAPRADTGVPGERGGELRDAAHPHPVVVATGQHRGARGGADRRHVEPVVGDAPLLHACEVRRPDATAEGVGPAEAGVVDEDDEDVGRTVGCFRRRNDAPVALGLVDRPTADTAEASVGDGEHAAVRLELAHRLGQLRLELVDTALVALDHGLQWCARKSPLDGKAGLGREHTDDHRRARLQSGTHLLLDGRGELVAREMADDPTGRRAHRYRTEHGWREHPHEHARSPAPTRATTTELVPCVHQPRSPVGVLANQDHPLARQLPGLDLTRQSPELRGGDLDIGVTRHDEHLRTRHGRTPSLGYRSDAYRKLIAATGRPAADRCSRDARPSTPWLHPRSRCHTRCS